ncbi:MAG TPA: selenium cofactor biosynthesis protein YqeC [Clostridia bacterium]|nr:selenium cofactor biosynthesis protein YqeC [Clostridia bacterium]
MQTIFYTSESGLAAAFDVPKGITALVGGGGKTTAMLRLARELAAGGARVIVTTTTHIFPPDGIPTGNPGNADEITHALLLEPLLCLGKPAADGKLGAPDLPMDTLANLADYVLVEADGAKHLPLKAPAEHEPVIPPETRLVIAVAGLDGIGQPIRDAAFRPELYAALCGKAETEPVTPRDIALVLAHESGQRKGVPANARFAVLLNKADDAGRRMSALAVATELGAYNVERAVIAQLEA